VEQQQQKVEMRTATSTARYYNPVNVTNQATRQPDRVRVQEPHRHQSTNRPTKRKKNKKNKKKKYKKSSPAKPSGAHVKIPKSSYMEIQEQHSCFLPGRCSLLAAFC